MQPILEYNLSEYQNTVLNNFVVKENPVWQDYPLFYCYAGLVGEVKEVFELLYSDKEITYDELESELGDITFYTALILHCLSKSQVILRNIEQTFLDPEEFNLVVGEIGRQLEKVARKSFGGVLPLQEDTIIECCISILSMCLDLLISFSQDPVDLNTLLKSNLVKLAERNNIGE